MPQEPPESGSRRRPQCPLRRADPQRRPFAPTRPDSTLGAPFSRPRFFRHSDGYHGGAPAASPRLGFPKSGHHGMGRKHAVDSPSEFAGSLPVNDDDLAVALIGGRPEIIVDQRRGLGRGKRVQIQGFLHWVSKCGRICSFRHMAVSAYPTMVFRCLLTP